MQVLYTYSVENIVRNDLQCLHDRSVLVVLTTRTSPLSDCLSHHTIFFFLPKTKTAQEIKNQFFATDKGRQLIGTVCGCRVEQTTDNGQRTTDYTDPPGISKFFNYWVVHGSQLTVVSVPSLQISRSQFPRRLYFHGTIHLECVASPKWM